MQKVHLLLLCIIAEGDSIDGRDTAVLNGALFGGTNGTAARVGMDGLPVDVEWTDGVSSTKFWANQLKHEEKKNKKKTISISTTLKPEPSLKYHSHMQQHLSQSIRS